MILIGSQAILKHGKVPPFYKGVYGTDHDYISTQEHWDMFKKSFERQGDDVEKIDVSSPNVDAFRVNGNSYYEAYITYKGKGDSDDMLMQYLDAYGKYVIAPLDVLLAIKTSHRYKKNTPFFLKTMATIKMLRSEGAKIPEELNDFVKLRMKESMNYSHPKLNVSKDTFFDDTIYTYDHDSIHLTVALATDPAYTWYIRDGEQVMTSKEKFFSVDDSIRLAGVYEETCVLALERSQVPNDFKVEPERSFRMALEKVCTSITSGWFREYAWENYEKVIKLYNYLGKDDYIKRFHENAHMLRPFK